MRPLDYVRTAFRDIITQPVRCVLTVAAITLSSALLVTLVSIGITTREAVVGHFEQGDTLSTIMVSANSSVGGGFFGSSIQATDTSAEKLTDETVSRLEKLRGVTSATPQVSIWELRSFAFDGNPTSYVSNTIATSNAGTAKPLAAGTWFDNADKTPNIVLGNGYLKALGIKDAQSAVGRTVAFTSVQGYRGTTAQIPAWNASSQAKATFDRSRTTIAATIVGVTRPSANDNQVYVPLEWGRAVQSPRVSTPTGETMTDSIAKNGYSNVLVTAASQDAVPGIAKDIEGLGLGAITYQKQIDQINQLSTVVWIILGSVALISLISASLGIVNTLLMSVSEQKQVIQIWRACGASKRMISRLYFIQAFIIGVVGAVAGGLIGYFACRLINARIETVLSSQGLESLQLPPPSLAVLAACMALSVLIAVTAAFYPARVAAKKITG